MSEPTAYSNADFIAPQALVISDGKPFKSPAVNTVASTFWYYVASTIFMALCVTQDVLKLSQLRKVSTILVVGHVFVFLLAIFRHAEEAPIRVLCRKIKRGRIAVVLKGVEPSAFNSDPQAARAFERAVEACVSGSEQKKPGAIKVTKAKAADLRADKKANRCRVTFTISSRGEEEPGGGQGDLAKALRDGSFLAELKSNLPAPDGVTVDQNGAMIDKVDSAMIDKIDRIDKTQFEKLYAGGGKELLEAAVFEAVLRSFDGNFRASYDLDDPWDRFCTQFCALETFWNEPVSEPHKRREAEIWLARDKVAQIEAGLKKQLEKAKENDTKIRKKLKELDDGNKLFLDLFFQPALATHQQKIDILIGLAASVSGDDERMSRLWEPSREGDMEPTQKWRRLKTTIKSDLEPTRWAWLRLEAEKRADKLKDNISKGLEINKEIEAIPRDGDIAVKGDPRQKLLLRSKDCGITEETLATGGQLTEGDDSGLITEAALRVVKRALAKDGGIPEADGENEELHKLLAKGKLMMDKEVLPPMLRVFAYMCLPALKRALDEVAGTVKKSLFKDVEVKCEERISVKKSKRMVAKMVNEIAEEEANKNAKDERWQPISASVRDALRATIVCPDEAAMCQVYEELKTPDGKFTLRKVKNKLKQKIVPFNLHAVYEFRPSPESVSILVEVQIKIKEIEDKCGAQHKFYEISRATGSADLFKPEVEAHDEQTYDEQHMEKIKQHKSERFMLNRSEFMTSRKLEQRDLVLVEQDSATRRRGGWSRMRFEFLLRRWGKSESVHPDQPQLAVQPPPVRRAVLD